MEFRIIAIWYHFFLISCQKKEWNFSWWNRAAGIVACGVFRNSFSEKSKKINVRSTLREKGRIRLLYRAIEWSNRACFPIETPKVFLKYLAFSEKNDFWNHHKQVWTTGTSISCESWCLISQASFDHFFGRRIKIRTQSLKF